MQTLTLATPSRTLFAAPYWVAEYNGYFAQEGIETKLAIIADGDQLKSQVRSGQTHLAIGPPDSVIVDALAGGALRIIAGNACKPPLYVISRPGIRTLAQLRGATFGVLSLKEGSSKLIPRIVAAAGLAMPDVNVIQAGGAPARKQLLLDGKIDVGLQPLPLNFEAEAAGLNNLGWTGEFERDWQFTTINANIEWARRHANLVVGALRGLLRGMAFMSTNIAAAAQIVAPELRTEASYVERALADSSKLGILHPRLDWTEPGLRKVFENIKQDGLVAPSESFNPGAYTTSEFLREAQANSH